MNRKLLSMITAITLTIGSTSQIVAGPWELVAGLGLWTAATHIRGNQVQNPINTQVQNQSNNESQDQITQQQQQQLVFETAINQHQRIFGQQCKNGAILNLRLEDIDTSKLQGNWRVFLSPADDDFSKYVGSNTLVPCQKTKEGFDIEKQTVFHAPIDTPKIGETQQEYAYRIEKEAARLRNLYWYIVNDRIQKGLDPVNENE